jgi:hypothetical protein
MSAQNTPALFLCDLETYDPRAPLGTPERRFCCPFCGNGKPKDAAHRCLAANVQNGAFKCYRCHTVGKLRDFWRAPSNAQSGATVGNRNAAQARRRAADLGAFELPPMPTPTLTPTVATAPANAPADATATPDPADRWRVAFKASAPLFGSHGETYLSGRGVPCELASAAGVRWSANWFGRAAVLFPLCDRAGALNAAQGRYLTDREGKPKAITGGALNQAIFATAGAFDWLKRGAPLVVTEAPIDALSIAAAGFPAFAFCGTNPPAWLHLAGGLRRVLLATDADDPGDRAAEKIAARLHTFGATCQRLRPEGAKDWNEFLTLYGADALSDFLAPPILAGD